VRRAVDEMIDRALVLGGVMLGCGVAWLVYASYGPLSLPERVAGNEAVTRVPDVSSDTVQIDVAAAVAGRDLIRPSRGAPAVLDTGAARKLAEKLQLQSVLTIDDERFAYVRVEGDGVRRVRAGEVLGGLLVESIDDESVELSLEGVLIALRF